MSCSNNSCSVPTTGGSRRPQYGDRKKSRRNKKTRGGFWPFPESTTSFGEKKSGLFSWFKSDSTPETPNTVSPVPITSTESVQSPVGGRSRRRRGGVKKSRSRKTRKTLKSRKNRRHRRK